MSLSPKTIRKMKTTHEDVVQYDFILAQDQIKQEVRLNTLLGKKITLKASGKIFCTACGNKTSKSFNQGYCFRCFQTLAECDTCIMSPEKCHFAAGSCRNEEWGNAYCNIPHTVYLANSSGLKIGITRQNQQKTRWMDQGAIQALPIATVATRHASGLAECVFKNFVADRTSWQKMLKGDVTVLDMMAEKLRLMPEWPKSIPFEIPTEAEAYSFNYPILEHPKKVTSLDFEKTPNVEGTLLGIKAQYLILDVGVLNIRKFGGYEVDFEF